MRKNSLNKTGLSLSQAQSISNLCNQRALEIGNQLSIVNNSEKKVTIGVKSYIETKGVPIVSNVVQLLQEKALLHATQAFLMENIKSKDNVIKTLQQAEFVFEEDAPESPKLENLKIIPLVEEEWGWEQLSAAELNEFYEAEAFASHIGQFIHRGGKLDYLRKELPTLKTLEWINIEDGKKTPLEITIHHTPEQLLGIHEELAGLHRKYEQRVNYFKAKVKNLVTEENARISKENANAQSQVAVKNAELRKNYNDSYNAWIDKYKQAQQEFEEKRQKDIKKIASLRINVDSRFQSTIDIFLKKIEGDEGSK